MTSPRPDAAQRTPPGSSAQQGRTAPPGLDLTALGPWFAENVSGAMASAELSASLIPGGRSNLTYTVTDGTASWILRRPPLGHVLATAHDMAREYRVITALAPTPVPVPATFGLCSDDSVIGAPFYVMELVEGTPYRRAGELAALGPQRTREIADGLLDTLVDLHAVDPAAVGLGDFGKVEGYLGRQVERWRRQLAASHSRDLPAANELQRRLAAAVPAESAAAIVHGDYRLDNVLVSEDRVTAVLDWEMATLGDPLTDLALMLVYHRLIDLLDVAAVSDAPAAPGFPTEAEFITRYQERSGRDLSDFGFYLALACYKVAGILEGIHYRYLAGKTVGSGFDQIGEAVVPMLELGLASLEE